VIPRIGDDEKPKQDQGKAEVNIRLASRGDALEMSRIMEEAIAEGSVLDSSTNILELLTKCPDRIWIAEPPGKTEDDIEPILYGWLSLTPFELGEMTREYVRGFLLFVSKHCRDHDIGRSLLEYALDRCNDLQVHKLVWTGLANNAKATSLCKTSGFREVGKYLSNMKIRDSWEDLVVMERVLDGPHKF